MTAHETVSTYYNAFNRKDWPAMLALLHDNVRHDPNQYGVWDQAALMSVLFY